MASHSRGPAEPCRSPTEGPYLQRRIFPVPDPRDTSIPLPLRWLIAHGITSLTPWHFLADYDRVAALRAEYRAETADGRDCFPFAVRQDCDDVAAFVVANGKVTDAVVDVHLTYSRGAEQKGFPREQRYKTFWAWLKSAVDDSADFASELDLDEIVADGAVIVSGGFNSDTQDGG